MLWLPARPDQHAAGYFREFLYGLTHNYPLHEAVKSAVRLGADLAAPPLLVSDPLAVDSLRLEKAVSAVVEQALALETRMIPGDVEGFLKRAGKVPLKLSRSLRQIDLQAAPLKTAIGKTASFKFSFNREVHGLEPSAAAMAEMESGRQQEVDLLEAYSSLADDPKSRETLARHQQRCVDVSLRRLGLRKEEEFCVRPTDPLHPQRRYQLRVQIGRRLPCSLMVGRSRLWIRYCPRRSPRRDISCR